MLFRPSVFMLHSLAARLLNFYAGHTARSGLAYAYSVVVVLLLPSFGSTRRSTPMSQRRPITTDSYYFLIVLRLLVQDQQHVQRS